MSPLRSRPPEHRVWDWLAAGDVPFTEPASALVARFGTDTDQPSGDPLCRIGDRLVPGQLAPLAFEPERETGPPAYPRRLWTTVYDGVSAEASFEAARRALEDAFGSGGRGYASNVVHREWQIGLAAVDLTWWPRHLNRGGSYGYPDPLRFEASLLAVRPAWMPALEAAERAALRRAKTLTSEPPRHLEESPAAYWRRADRVPSGIHVDAETVFVVGDRVVAVPVSDLEAVKRVDIAPAKGGGGSGVSLETVGRGRVHVAQAGPGGLGPLADALARQTGCVLEVETGIDA